MIAQNFKSYYFSELRLVDGPSRCQGRLEIRPDSSAEFGTACDNDVGSNEATVICRQLNCGTDGATAVPATTYVKKIPECSLIMCMCIHFEFIIQK